MDKGNVKNILVAPLDWGLGHTTRCIPIIRYLRALGHTITVAGNDWQQDYVSKTLPGIETIYLEGYNVRYSGSNRRFLYAIGAQVPRILKTIRREHEWLMQQASDQKFDAVISDNRYGLFHPQLPSVIMTHQLQLKTGLGEAVDELMRRLHYKYLQRYTQCWVVDVAQLPGLAGTLSHPTTLPVNAQYIGLLSQLVPSAAINERGNLLVLLSGPEPQRSILSQLLWQQLQDYNGQVTFVAGVDEAAPGPIPKHINYHKRLTSEALVPLLQQAEMVICRSGYSTLMDLVLLNKKAILIPTPGQTEQEYLARQLQQAGIFYSHPQKGLDIKRALQEAAHFPYTQWQLNGATEQYKVVIDNWLRSI